MEDLPVDEEHGEDDVEPRVLWGGVRKEKPSWTETYVISRSRPFIVTPFTEYRTVTVIITQLVQRSGGDGASTAATSAWYRMSGLHIVCGWYPTADMTRYVH